MATKNIIPRNNNEGKIGTNSKKWAEGHFESLSVAGQSVSGGGATALNGLTDVTITNPQNNQLIQYNNSSNMWVNVSLTADGLSEGSSNLYFTNARSRSSISVTGSSGDGSLSYSNTSGVLTYTGPSAAETRAHFSAGSGVTLSSGAISIGQAVETSSNVTFNNLVVSGDLTVSGNTTTIDTETINLSDNTILLNSNYTGSSPSENCGIEVERGTQANKTLVWNETTDKWTIGSETFIAGTFEGDLTGNVTGTVSSIANHDINSLSNVTITSASNSQILTYNGTSWINSTPTTTYIEQTDVKVETTSSSIEFYQDPQSNSTQTKTWEMEATGNFLPGTDIARNIGSSSKRINELYLSDNSLNIVKNNGDICKISSNSNNELILTRTTGGSAGSAEKISTQKSWVMITSNSQSPVSLSSESKYLVDIGVTDIIMNVPSADTHDNPTPPNIPDDGAQITVLNYAGATITFKETSSPSRLVNFNGTYEGDGGNSAIGEIVVKSRSLITLTNMYVASNIQPAWLLSLTPAIEFDTTNLSKWGQSPFYDPRTKQFDVSAGPALHYSAVSNSSRYPGYRYVLERDVSSNYTVTMPNPRFTTEDTSIYADQAYWEYEVRGTGTITISDGDNYEYQSGGNYWRTYLYKQNGEGGWQSVGNSSIVLNQNDRVRVYPEYEELGTDYRLKWFVVFLDNNLSDQTFKIQYNSAAANKTIPLYDSADNTFKESYFAFPASDGTANQVLKTDGSGTLSWADQTSGSGSGDIEGVTAGGGLSGGGTSGSVSLALDLNELTAADVDVASDSITIIDANDGNGSKKESIADLITAVAGNGLASSSGVISTSPQVITVTVVSSGGNKYALDGVTQKVDTLVKGVKYRFDQSDGTNIGHPLAFSTASDGGGSSYTTGVTSVGSPGSSGAYTEIIVPHSAPLTLYYYCTNHSGMGASVLTGSSNSILQLNTSVTTTDSGTNGKITFNTDGTDRWEITSDGHLLPKADNTFDIGSASYKVRDLYVSDNSFWLGDDHKMSIRAGKISHKKRKKTTNYIPRAFANYLSQGSFNRSKLLAIKKASNGGDGTGTGTGGAADSESELTLADWTRYANATQIDGVNVSNRFRSSKSGGPQEGKWSANDIFDEDDDFEEIIDPSSATNLDLDSFSGDAKATSIDDSSPSATKFPTEAAVKTHVDTRISATSLNDLSNVNTSGVSSGQVLKYDGTRWAPATDNTGGSGSGGSRPTIAAITASDFSGSPSVYLIPDQGSSVMELVCLVNAAGGVSRTIKLPSAGSDDVGLKIQVKRIGSDPVSVSPASNDYVDGTQNNSLALPHQNSSLTFICTSDNNWYII